MNARKLGARAPAAAAILAFATGCMETYDVGSTRPHGLLPVDERNPMVLVNDGAYDNWSGEYAVLLAATGTLKLAGIVVDATFPWPNIQTNVDGWRGLISAARTSGVRNLPDPIASVGSALVMPASGNIDDTQPNRSEGALFIVETSKRLSLPYRPLVVATGGPLTDVADAYLVDPTVVERVVVVSSLGGVTTTGGGMGPPNGDFDPWADTIVAQRFRYVQVSAAYDQLNDVPNARLADLPANALGTWMAAKQPNLYHWTGASDQVSVIAVALSGYATAVQRVAAAGSIASGATAGPDLAPDAAGSTWLVTGSDTTVPTAWLWDALSNPATFAP
jgi:hypothetical protein